jgi:hypothetical protein
MAARIGQHGEIQPLYARLEFRVPQTLFRKRERSGGLLGRKSRPFARPFDGEFASRPRDVFALIYEPFAFVYKRVSAAIRQTTPFARH